MTTSAKKILILGGRGYVGSSFSTELGKTGHDIYIADRSESGWLPPGAEIKLIRGSITDGKFLEDCFKEHKFDIVFNFAGIEYDRKNFSFEKDLEVNGLSARLISEALCRSLPEAYLVHISSVNIFESGTDINEESKNHPDSPWSIHKLLAENYITYFSRKYRFKSCILRLANVFGPCARPELNERMVVNRVIQNAVMGKDLLLYENHKRTREFIYIDDVVRALRSLVEQPLNGLYIISTGEKLTFENAWALIAENTPGGRNSIVLDATTKLEPFDHREFGSNTGLFSELTGWEPKYDFRAAVKMTAEYFKKRINE